MAQTSYEINEGAGGDGEYEVPCTRREIDNAKLYLQKFCPEAGDTLYDHLSEVLNKILAERPRNPFASFAEYSRKLRDDKFRLKNDYLRDVYGPPPRFEEAKVLLDLFRENLAINEDNNLNTTDDGEEHEETENPKIQTPNLLELFYYFEQVDVGLPRSEVVLLNLSIRKLAANAKIKDVRFWGKIMGRSKNYYVVEARLPDYEIERRLRLLDEEKEEASSNGDAEETKKKRASAALETKLSSEEAEEEEEFTEGSGSDSLKLVLPPLPINTWEPAPKVFPEKLGTGVNAWVYFVCNAPGLDDWVELPEVTPEQIVVARQIAHVFTGNLDAQGHLAPNRRYKSLPATELTDPSNWCHHAPYILKQGRATWLEPGKADESKNDSDRDEEEEEEEGEEKEENEEEDENGVRRRSSAKGATEKEIGPGLLRPLSEDAAEKHGPTWTGRLSSRAIQPDAAVALVRSNLWPGAFAFAADKKYGNVYIGWGQKQQAYNYNPPAMPEVQEQYVPIGNELVEAQDPSFDEEEAYRLAHLPPEDDAEEEEEEEEVETEEEDDV